MKTNPLALLLVDGYNIIGQWVSLKRTREKYGLELARQELTEILINFSGHEGYQTQLVFDAQLQNSPATQEIPSPHLTVHYTAWLQTADTFIEKRCAHFSRNPYEYPSRVIVATSDRAQQLTVVGYGAECMSAKRLQQAVNQSQNQLAWQGRAVPKTKHRRPSASRSNWVNGLDPSIQDKLSQWRMGLD